MEFECIRNGKLTSRGNQLNAVGQEKEELRDRIRFLSGASGKKETHR